MSLYNFGSGLLFATTTTGISYGFGTLQDVAVDFEQDIKMLYGSLDYPDIIAGGKSKCTIKAKFGLISGAMFNSIFFGGTSAAGMTILTLAEAASVPASSVYTVTVANASGAGIVTNSIVDLGVRYAISGTALQNIGTGTPTVGQYTVTSAGVYTFAAADASAQLLFSYTYKTSTSTTGTTFARTAQLMGTSVYFSLFLSNSFNGVQSNMKFFRVKSTKLSRQTKNDDFTVPEMDFSAFNDPAGRVFESYEAAP